MGNESAINDYNWIMLEFYDQVIRNTTDGEMQTYIQNIKSNDPTFIVDRIGNEFNNIQRNSVNEKQLFEKNKKQTSFLQKAMYYFTYATYKNKLKRLLFNEDCKYIEIGKFRQSGEIHQWMYDRFSLKQLMEETGFICVVKITPFYSSIPDWDKYSLDVSNGQINKPDSLFMEGMK